MKQINLTLNNSFRHPLRWGRCPLNLREDKIYGLFISWGQKNPASFKDRWAIGFYFGTRYKVWSNYPLI